MFLLMVGLFLAVQSLRLSVWSAFGPDEGFFPLAVAVLIMILSLIILVKSVRPDRVPRKTETAESQRGKGERIFKVISYALLMSGYGLLMERLGFLIASVLLLFPIARIVESQSWRTALLLSLISIATSYILFAYLLGVPLPRGLVTGW